MTMAIFGESGETPDGRLFDSLEIQALNVLPMPVIVVGDGHAVLYANTAADTIGKLDPLIVGRAHVVYERGERAAGAIL